MFRFETTGALNVSPLSAFLNVLSIAAAFVLAAFALKKKWLSPIISAGTVIVIAFSIFSGYNSLLIQKSFSRLQALQGKREEITSLEKTYSLSRSKRNVIIVMTDTAISGFLKPIFDARPELYDDFKGFTYYPNTVSFSKHTLMGVPPIWGGFEYTPLEMNKKREATLKEKHNQSLLTLPVILSNNGYEVTVTDPSWANYEWTADTSIYDGFENIKAFNSIGRYTAYWYKDHEFGNNAIASTTIKRNSLFFSFMMIIPPPLRFAVYDKGHYWGAADKTDAINGLIDNYAPLDYLPNLMSFDADKPQALFITNELAHQPYILQYPDYRPVPAVTDQGPGVYSQNESYHSNAALLILLSKWLRELKRQNVYNNTRIIIVADHGAGSGLISDIALSIQGEHREGYNPLLLVKDFDSLEDFSEDPSFMTTADTPILALKGIVDEPENPFTGKPLSSDYKKDGVFITTNHQPMKEDHGKYQFNIKDDQWVFVKDDIKKADNWKRVEPQINEYND